MKRATIYTSWLLVSILGAASAWCPNPEELKPCVCHTLFTEKGDEIATIICSGITHEDAIYKAASATVGKDIFEFSIVDSNLRYLPNDAFKGTTFNVISIYNSSLHALTDTDVAFEGLERELNVLEIKNCSFISDWDWNDLRHLERLMELRVTESDLLYITKDMDQISHLNLEQISFNQNLIHVLEDGVFAPFQELQRLYLDRNIIDSIQRTMLPSPVASRLEILGLSYNMIHSLPTDIFTNMPTLRSLYLSGNPIHTLDERTFGPIWNQLKLFFFNDVSLNCDCRLLWLTRSDLKGKFVDSKCKSPSNLKGKLVVDIKPNDLWC